MLCAIKIFIAKRRGNVWTFWCILCIKYEIYNFLCKKYKKEVPLQIKASVNVLSICRRALRRTWNPVHRENVFIHFGSEMEWLWSGQIRTRILAAWSHSERNEKKWNIQWEKQRPSGSPCISLPYRPERKY